MTKRQRIANSALNVMLHGDHGAAVAALNRHLASCLADVASASAPSSDPAFADTEHGLFVSITPVLLLDDYVRHLAKHMRASAAAILAALVLLHRAGHARHRGCADALRHIPPLTRDTAHKLALAALLVAIKVVEDDHFGQRFYAGCSGVSTRDVNELELAFLRGLQFRVGCTVEGIEACFANFH